jgi:hypothetical protein
MFPIKYLLTPIFVFLLLYPFYHINKIGGYMNWPTAFCLVGLTWAFVAFFIFL